MKINLDSINIVVSKSENPQIRGFFTIEHGQCIKNPTGAIANTLFTKDMKLKSLNSLKPLKRVIDRENPKQIVTEIYII